MAQNHLMKNIITTPFTYIISATIVFFSCQNEQEDDLTKNNVETTTPLHIKKGYSSLETMLQQETFTSFNSGDLPFLKRNAKIAKSTVSTPLSRAIVDKLYNTQSSPKRTALFNLFTSADGVVPDAISFNKTEAIDYWGYTENTSDYIPVPNVSQQLNLRPTIDINPPHIKELSRTIKEDTHTIQYFINTSNQALATRVYATQQKKSKISWVNEYEQAFELKTSATFSTGIKMIAEGEITATVGLKIGFKQIKGSEEVNIFATGQEFQNVIVPPRSVLKVTFLNIKEEARFSFKSNVKTTGAVGVNYGHPVKNYNSETAHYFWALPAERITQGYLEDLKGTITSNGYRLLINTEIICLDNFTHSPEEIVSELIDLTTTGNSTNQNTPYHCSSNFYNPSCVSNIGYSRELLTGDCYLEIIEGKKQLFIKQEINGRIKRTRINFNDCDQCLNAHTGDVLPNH